MAYKQVKQFNLAKMGRKSGWCLQNVRLGFGIANGKFPSAKADMESQRKNGTLHSGTPPTNIAVPVYCDTLSRFEHVVAWDHGKVYSDGTLIPRGLAEYKTFGWGELCDGVRVVEYTPDPQPSGFLPSRGYWRFGDTDARIGRMASWMRKTFPAYTPAAATGNYFGPNLLKAVKEFQRRTGLETDGNIGPLTLAKMQQYGFGG